MSYITGLFGRGITKSLSPAIHEGEALRLGATLCYKIADFDELKLSDADLGTMLLSAARLGFSGVNITHPFKQLVIPYLDSLSPEAQLLGAVNTVVIRDGQLHGHNTDWFGFAESFKLNLPRVPTKKVLQLGAGGAGAALVYALLRMGVQELYLSDPQELRVNDLRSRFEPVFPKARIEYCPTPEAVLPLVDGVVQASPIGMAHHAGMPMNPSGLKRGQWVVDIIYFPAETEFLKAARQKGCKTANGGGMVVFQAAEAFRLFTGMVPDQKRMLRGFKQ